MLSRVASNIYWAGRYLERAENVARFLAVNQDLSLEAHTDEATQWAPLISTTGDSELYYERVGTVTRASAVHFLAYDREYHNSIVGALWLARENARSVRNIISRDMWQRINALFLTVQELARRASLDESDLVNFVEVVKLGCITVQGITNSTLSRDEAWHWWRIGSMLERADKTSRILDVKYYMLLPTPEAVGSNFDHLQWISLLDSASAAQMFRQTQRHLNPSEIANFLILNQHFPRAIAHAIAQADLSLHEITGTPAGQFDGEAERALGKFRADLCYADIDEAIAGGLHEFLDGCQLQINRIDELLGRHYFGIDSDAA